MVPAAVHESTSDQHHTVREKIVNRIKNAIVTKSEKTVPESLFIVGEFRDTFESHFTAVQSTCDRFFRLHSRGLNDAQQWGTLVA